jgi:hypothetical protein
MSTKNVGNDKKLKVKKDTSSACRTPANSTSFMHFVTSLKKIIYSFGVEKNNNTSSANDFNGFVTSIMKETSGTKQTYAAVSL